MWYDDSGRGRISFYGGSYDKKRDDIGVSIALAPWILLGFCIWRLCDIWLLKI